eukprot:TRINITY_DN6101_c0_g1_i1.p1 TRINITY_DN6101_c0_g1~~TRINITY_DN6101_c0_g1_i1.p1  ORF type:complete len:235 (-),score=28.77 TRINITY_DN6101_c0_g1_i1:51-755(-)
MDLSRHIFRNFTYDINLMCIVVAIVLLIVGAVWYRVSKKPIQKQPIKSKKKFKIYTKTGNDGTSALFDGTRLEKSHAFFNAIGTVDELNSFLGHAIEHCLSERFPPTKIEELRKIQSFLFDIGAIIADTSRVSDTTQLDERIKKLENWIDEIEEQVEPLRSFILPSGGLAATAIHICRTVCRRCERVVMKLKSKETINPNLIPFLNILSDYFFNMTRFAIFYKKRKVIEWDKNA